MSLTEDLKKYEVDVDKALERFMGNEAMYEKMLEKFPSFAESHEIISYIKSGDIKTAAANAHTLKGVTGNLSMTPLFTAYTEIEALLRKEESEQALTALEGILTLQNNIIECINSR